MHPAHDADYNTLGAGSVPPPSSPATVQLLALSDAPPSAPLQSCPVGAYIVQLQLGLSQSGTGSQQQLASLSGTCTDGTLLQLGSSTPAAFSTVYTSAGFTSIWSERTQVTTDLTSRCAHRMSSGASSKHGIPFTVMIWVQGGLLGYGGIISFDTTNACPAGTILTGFSGDIGLDAITALALQCSACGLSACGALYSKQGFVMHTHSRLTAGPPVGWPCVKNMPCLLFF